VRHAVSFLIFWTSIGGNPSRMCYDTSVSGYVGLQKRMKLIKASSFVDNGKVGPA
jgi:hypothetical protein